MNRIEISFAEPMSIGTDSTNEEFDLLESLGKRNQTALGTLIDRYYKKLLQLAKMFFPNETEAEEVVQEMRAKVLEGVKGFEGRSCLEILIVQILTKRSQAHQGQEKWRKSSPVH